MCRNVDNAISEVVKVGHIPNGTAHDAFNLLLSKACATVGSVFQVCRQFEQATPPIAHRFDRLPNTTATMICKLYASRSIQRI